MSDKIYAKGMFIKEKNVGSKSLLAISVNVEKFTAFLQENANSKGYVNLDCWKNAQADQYGNTHNAVLNTYQKEASQTPTPQRAATKQANEPLDDLPF